MVESLAAGVEWRPPEATAPGFAPLHRRGRLLGHVRHQGADEEADTAAAIAAWRQDRPAHLPGWLRRPLADAEAMLAASRRMMEALLEGAPLEALLDAPDVAARLQGDLQDPLQDGGAARFALVAASDEEHDAQAIGKAWFDAETNDGVAEDLWCKASWLSFHEADASLRFRFSFGMEGFEDVAADPGRELLAGELAARVFPESRLLTGHAPTRALARELAGGQPAFVERIIYFNAPEGGAQFHHDVERGHDGVIYAQLTGRTFWLACDKQALMDEITAFVADAPDARWNELRALTRDRAALAALMNEADHEPVEALVDREPAFIGRMVEHGHAFWLEPGDALLLPQRDLEHCVWHTVFCLDDEPGEALSFAIRAL